MLPGLGPPHALSEVSGLPRHSIALCSNCTSGPPAVHSPALNHQWLLSAYGVKFRLLHEASEFLNCLVCTVLCGLSPLIWLSEIHPEPLPVLVLLSLKCYPMPSLPMCYQFFGCMAPPLGRFPNFKVSHSCPSSMLPQTHHFPTKAQPNLQLSSSLSPQ